MSHKLAEPYSGKNPVPQIATKLTSLINPEHATRAKAAQLQDQSNKQDQKQTQKTAARLAKGYIMHVVDPVTGEELDIKNADEEPDVRNRGENVLENDFPPPDWKEHRAHVVSVVTPTIMYIAGAYTLSFLLARLISNSILVTSLALVPPTLLAYALQFRVYSISRKDFDDRVWHSERVRGLLAGSDLNGDGQVGDEERTKESAEWANAILRGVWPIMNPNLFGSIIDLLEDIMQSSVPKFVHSVRIADLGLGSNAARITAIRSLPDSSAQKSKEDNFRRSEDKNQEDDQGQEQTSSSEEREELDGQHVNVELSFAYRGLPSGKSAASKARNIHLLVEFFLGIRGLYGLKVPVWVEITGAIGTARARLQLISDPPFVKTTMVTLLGLPRITISVIALSPILPNVMNLPFISGFVSSSIDTAVAEYVAPKSITLDLQRLISGDDIKKDTDAIGVLVVHMHRAKGVKAMDANGSSVDPYVTLTYSRLGKPLYSTRIIKADCNPNFEETAIVLVDLNTIRLREKLSFQLWDSDRMTVDDLLGVVEVDIIDLTRHSTKPQRRSTPLSHPHTKHVPGSFEYTVGYYGKRAPSSRLRTSGIDPGIPEDMAKRSEFQNAKDIAMNDLEAAVLVTPPDPEWPSGVLSVQLHEIRGLGVKKEGRERNVMKSVRSREGEKGQDDDGDEQEEAEGLPSSYCTISLNDELVYQTRVKPITSTPIFNAGTERFVRDWRKAHVSVTVKDSRMREKDAILGVVMLKLSDLLVNASQITRLYSIEDGLGYGRIRVSLVFRPVEAKLPPSLLGFDTGTLNVHDLAVKLNGQQDMDLTKCQVRLKTTKSGADEKVSREVCHKREDGIVVWASEEENIKGLPVRVRYSSALLLSFKDASSTMGLRRTGKKALAVLWLRDIVDNDEQTIEIPLWHVRDGDYSRLKMNYSPPDGDLSAWDQDKEKVVRVGSVWIHLAFVPGLNDLHHDMMDGGGSKRKEAWEAYTREREGGLRDSIGETGQVDQDSDDGDGNSRPSHVKARGSDPDKAGDPPSNTSDHNQEDDWEAPAHEKPSMNTMVSSEAVENEPIGRHSSSTLGGVGSGEDATDDTQHEGEGHRGVIQKLKDWKHHEQELHREHRGVMQMKPARTAEWVKDNVEEGVHSIKDRFSMKTQKPGVETEV